MLHNVRVLNIVTQYVMCNIMCIGVLDGLQINNNIECITTVLASSIS